MKAILVPVLSAAAFCANAHAGEAAALAAPDVPAALRVPAGQAVFLKAFAKGVQIYECAAKADLPSTYEWKLTGPEATLADASGKSIGRHYAGPTWEASDGSAVVGEVKARDAGPNASAIPWLLLAARSTSGHGVLSATTSVQRVDTVGGLPPADACNETSVKKTARSAYTATYVFYRSAH